MTFHILSLFPDIFSSYLHQSLLAKAIDGGLITVDLVNIRDYAADKHKTCDDYTYGGGAGMVLKPEPLFRAMELNGFESLRTLHLTPSGNLFNQAYAEELKREKELVMICGRYEGIDQRIIDTFVSDEVSIGDFVLSGGEVAAMVIIDTLSRLIKGVISNQDSLNEESFQYGVLEYPHYTKPAVYRGLEVPAVLLSGHHAKIREWRIKKSVQKTQKYRPELLDPNRTTNEIKKIKEEIDKEIGDE